MRKSRFSEEQIIGILKRVERGQALADVCRELGISEGTYYRWKAQYGGLEVSQLRRLRQLEAENQKLKQVVADLTLDNRALKDIASKSRYVAHDISSDENAARSRLRRAFAVPQHGERVHSYTRAGESGGAVGPSLVLRACTKS
jgi:putative transposase